MKWKRTEVGVNHLDKVFASWIHSFLTWSDGTLWLLAHHHSCYRCAQSEWKTFAQLYLTYKPIKSPCFHLTCRALHWELDLLRAGGRRRHQSHHQNCTFLPDCVWHTPYHRLHSTSAQSISLRDGVKRLCAADRNVKFLRQSEPFV